MKRKAQPPSFQCCFCGARIVDDGVEPLQLLVVERNEWRNELDNPMVQSFFAHVDCLGSKLDASVPFLSRAERGDY